MHEPRTHRSVLLDRRDAVAILTLNEPESLNALSGGIKSGLEQNLPPLLADPSIRAIVLTGAGKDAIRAADLARVEHILGQLGETAQRALKEMRLMIYELHPPALTQEGLAAALRQRLAAVEQRAGVTAELVIETPIDPITPMTAWMPKG